MILLILILSILDIAASNEITLHKGSFTLQSYSTSNTTNIQIPYMICFRSLPAYVYATVTPTDQSLPHNFTLNVEEIRENSFIAEMIRTDGVNNWDTPITVKWTLFFERKSLSIHRSIRLLWELSSRESSQRPEQTSYGDWCATPWKFKHRSWNVELTYNT
uniref:uncharacterized protein LOC108950372 n=1 Tax=Ciona intestinalis TaxID=7719 RepID=UPI000EF51EBC|nr:uncharacterized protein LOC108950372 [Ciona intestinalis]|eukprot:XP_026694703.1 uncharacterized protein LOC108950372 [Ciona intestinalis]